MQLSASEDALVDDDLVDDESGCLMPGAWIEESVALAVSPRLAPPSLADNLAQGEYKYISKALSYILRIILNSSVEPSNATPGMLLRKSEPELFS